MLLVISDLHLWDGTIGLPMSPQGFSLFASRLRELVYQASWRVDGRYKPVEQVDILLLGDIVDPLQSSRWLKTWPGDADYIRPWHDPQNPLYAPKLKEVTRAIIEQNSHPLDVVRKLKQGDVIRIPPANARGKPDFYSRERWAPPVNIHYMVGNHDWYYLIPGPKFNEIRRELMQAFGIPHDGSPFIHQSYEDLQLDDMLAQYGVVARHGDIFDNFTYNRERGRIAAALSDIYSSEVVFRFPADIDRQLGPEKPAISHIVSQIYNVRPLLAAPLWLRARIHELTLHPALEQKVKSIWNRVISDFMDISSVHEITRHLPKGEMSALRFILSLSRQTSFQTMADVSGWLTRNMWQGERSLAPFARKEPAIQNKSASFVVYGHTHTHEVIPLDNAKKHPQEAEQVYINTGTWGTFYELDARRNDKKTSNLLTCVAFYKGGERAGRRFETWWANFA